MSKFNKSIFILVTFLLFITQSGTAKIYSYRQGNKGAVKYMALGDSISTGWGLDSSLSFPVLFAKRFDLEYNNYAVPGMAIPDFLYLLNSSTMVGLKDADLITVTMGANDYMRELYNFLYYQGLYDAYGKSEAALIICELMAEDSELNKEMIAVTDRAVAVFESNWQKLIPQLLSCAPNADIIIVNLYNPLPDFDSYGFNDFVGRFMQRLNKIIENYARDDYYVADVYTAFQNESQATVNSYFRENGISLDVHLTVHGNKVIADTVAELYEIYSKNL